MTTKTYATKMEQKLVDEFKQKFFEKMGYSPVVITRVTIEADSHIPVISLQQLAECFTPFLPTRYGKVLTLKTKARYREIIELRNIFCAIARNLKYTYSIIGQELGNRDHTTVIHNIQSFRNLIETDAAFKQKYLTILKYIKEKYNEQPVVEHSNSTQDNA